MLRLMWRNFPLAAYIFLTGIFAMFHTVGSYYIHKRLAFNKGIYEYRSCPYCREYFRRVISELPGIPDSAEGIVPYRQAVKNVCLAPLFEKEFSKECKSITNRVAASYATWLLIRHNDSIADKPQVICHVAQLCNSRELPEAMEMPKNEVSRINSKIVNSELINSQLLNTELLSAVLALDSALPRSWKRDGKAKYARKHNVSSLRRPYYYYAPIFRRKYTRI